MLTMLGSNTITYHLMVGEIQTAIGTEVIVEPYDGKGVKAKVNYIHYGLTCFLLTSTYQIWVIHCQDKVVHLTHVQGVVMVCVRLVLSPALHALKGWWTVSGVRLTAVQSQTTPRTMPRLHLLSSLSLLPQL